MLWPFHCGELYHQPRSGQGCVVPPPRPPPQEVLPAGNPALPPPPAATRGQDPPDLYSRKSEYTEKAPSTGPFL